MHVNVSVSTLHDSSAALGWSAPFSLTIDRSAQVGGLGVGFNGGQLLFLAIGACYCNDIFREAGKMGIKVNNVRVDVQGDFAGEPNVAHNVTYTATVEADADQAQIEELIRHTDRIAEIHNSLRLGTPVTLAEYHAISEAATSGNSA